MALGSGYTIALVKSACVGDLNGDLVVDSADVGVMLCEFGACDPGNPADLDSNGSVDSADVGGLLIAFGACP